MYKEPDKIDYPESDPDYYQQKFMPVWKEYRVFSIFKVLYIFIFILFLLIEYFNFMSKDIGIIILVGLVLSITFYGPTQLYFYGIFGKYAKLRCPKCGRNPEGGLLSLGTVFTLTGECQNCHVQLHKRIASDDIAKLINIVTKVVNISVVLALIYLLLNFDKFDIY